MLLMNQLPEKKKSGILRVLAPYIKQDFFPMTGKKKKKKSLLLQENAVRTLIIGNRARNCKGLSDSVQILLYFQPLIIWSTQAPNLYIYIYIYI